MLTIVFVSIAILVCFAGYAKKQSRPNPKQVEDSIRELAKSGDAAGLRDACYRYLMTKTLKDKLTSTDYMCREIIGLMGAKRGDMNDVYESLVFFTSNSDAEAGRDYTPLIDTLTQRYLELVEEDQQKTVAEGWYVSTQCDKNGCPEIITHIYQEPAGWKTEVIGGCRMADEDDNIALTNILYPTPLTMNEQATVLKAVYGGEKFDNATDAQIMGRTAASIVNTGLNTVSKASSLTQIGAGAATSLLGAGLLAAAQAAAQSAKVTKRVISLQINNNHDGTLKVDMSQLSRMIYPDRETTDTLNQELTLVKLYPHNSGLLYSKSLKSILTYRGLMALDDEKEVGKYLQLFHPCTTQGWIYRVYRVKTPVWHYMLPSVYFVPKHFAVKKKIAKQKKGQVIDMKRIDFGRLNLAWYTQWAWQAFFDTGEEYLDDRATYYYSDDGTILVGRMKDDGKLEKDSKLYKRTKQGIISCDTAN